MEIHTANIVNKIAELFKIFITDGHVSLLGRHCMYSVQQLVSCLLADL